MDPLGGSLLDAVSVGELKGRLLIVRYRCAQPYKHLRPDC
jgi:hypothetical protein